MNGQEDFEDVRTLLHQFNPGPPLDLDVATVIRGGRRRRRLDAAQRWAEVALVLGASLAVTGLLVGNPFGHKDAASSSSGTTAGTSQSALPTASAAASPSGVRTSPLPATRACGAADLRISAADGGMAGGSWAQIILFQNTSSTPCSLRGYPAVVASVMGGGQPVRAISQASGYLGGTFTLASVPIAPGGSASAMIEGGNNPVGSAATCPTLSNLIEVTPPGVLASVQVKLQATPLNCVGVAVHPVVAGMTGRPAGQ